MADDQTQQPQQPQVATEEAPTWVKNPQTGEVMPLWKPEDLHAARANKFVDATPEEAAATHRQMQLEGWKGTALAAGAGVASAVPFARNLIRRVAPKVGQEVDEAAEVHPWVKGATELAAVAGLALATGGTSAAAEGAEVAGATALERAVPAALEEAVTTAKAAGPIRALMGEGEAALAGKAAPKGLEAVLPGGVEKAIIAEGNPHLTREALRQVEEHIAETATAIPDGVGGAVPSLAQRVLGRVPDAARQAAAGAAYGGIDLTNEKDLGHSPEEVAGHVMSTLFWGAAGGAVGGMAIHGITKAASPLVEAVGEKFGKLGEVLENAAGAIKTGGNPEALINKSRSALQGGLDAMDKMANQKTIDRGMEAVRKKVGDGGMKELDAARVGAEDAYNNAKADVMRMLGMPTGEDGARRISVDKLTRALKSDTRQDAVEAMQRLHEAGKKLHDFHEQLAEAGATGLEGLGGAVKEQVDGLLEVQNAMKAGIAKAEQQGAMGQIKDALGLGVAGEVASHFGHHLLGSIAPILAAGKVAALLWKLAPAEFKAARLSQLARLGAGVDAHLERVAGVMHAGGVGKLVAPAVAGMSLAELNKLREDVNQKLSNPQLAQDHLEERAGVMQHFAPDAYGQMGIQYGQQLQTLAGILQWPHMEGPFQPQYMPSASERAKMSTQVAIVKDPKVAEAKIAKGTATPTDIKTYQAAHPARAAALGQKFASGLKQGAKQDAANLKTMTGAMLLGITPRASYSQPVLQGIQGMYSMKATQQGGPGSRGGTGGAKALTASQMISLPGQRVSNRPVK